MSMTWTPETGEVWVGMIVKAPLGPREAWRQRCVTSYSNWIRDQILLDNDAKTQGFHSGINTS